MKILSLDPSVNHVGWATLEIEKGESIESGSWDWGCWELDGFNFNMRCQDLRDRIIEEGVGDFDTLVVEWPAFYDSMKGKVAAKQGHTLNLAGICMYVVGWFHMDCSQVHLVTAPQWKGNTPKQVTAKRFFDAFGVNHLKESEHAIDATMMLLAYGKKQSWYIG